MTITLTQLTDLQRVQVALSNRPDGTVQVQRVINPAATEALWARGVVRGGLALPIVGGIGVLDDFEFPADIANHFRVVPIDPPAGLLLDGTAGSYAVTPDVAALDIVGDLRITADVTPDEWASGANQNIAAKYVTTGSQRSYRLLINGSGFPQLGWTTDGISGPNAVADVLPPFALFPRLTIRAQLDVDTGSGWSVAFYWATSPAGPFTQFDEVTGSPATSVFASTAPMEIGSVVNGTLELFAGTIHSVQVENGIGGPEVANPDFAAQPHGTTNFVDAAGRSWTVNGTAAVVGIEQASITPSLAGRVWLKHIRYPALNRPVTTTEFDDPARASRDTATEIAGRSVPVGQNELRASPEFTLELQTTTLEEAGELDIILAAGGVFFVHVPANCPIPGGYVQLGATNQVRRTRSARSPRRYTTLPCRIVAPPPPQMTGTLLTAETIFRLYGSATALYAAHATGRSLLATIADPSDLVVI